MTDYDVKDLLKILTLIHIVTRVFKREINFRLY